MDLTPSAAQEELRRLVTSSLQPLTPAAGPGAVGLESEHFLIRVAGDGAPRGRVDLADLTRLLDHHPALVGEPADPQRLTGWRASDGVRVMPEPGAQVEVAGPPAAHGGAALAQLRSAVADLAALAERDGIALVSAGLDVWHPGGAVDQQLRCPRYPAMHAYLARRSPHGHTMMTGTAALQVNLDLGGPRVAGRRWATALMATPLLTSTFACSPVPGAVNGRAVVWQWMDPTRTGVPPAFVAGRDDPVEVLVHDALRADVLLFNRGGTAHPGRPGFTLADWLVDGHPEHGRPTAADLAYHLTTLFPEVRVRGFLEVRSVDALPERWRAVPVVLLAGLLYDDRTLEDVHALLTPLRRRLPELLRRAAHVGVADGELCALAVEVWTAAARGAARLGPGWFDPADIRRAEAFLDRFTLRGRCPADELRDRLAEGAASALDWAREPVGAFATC